MLDIICVDLRYKIYVFQNKQAEMLKKAISISQMRCNPIRLFYTWYNKDDPNSWIIEWKRTPLIDYHQTQKNDMIMSILIIMASIHMTFINMAIVVVAVAIERYYPS
jgi:hypothetical protein